MLKAIFFDIDDTLYSTSDFAREARRNSVQAMIQAGLNMAEEDCIRELNEVVTEFGSNYDRHYNKLLLRIPRKYYAHANPAIIVAAGVVAYHQTKAEKFRPFEDVVDVLDRLSKTSLILGVITAGLTTKQSEKLVRLNLHAYFRPQAIFITEEMGIWKPNPKLYLRACQHLNLPCEECMYVGDRATHDIDPANAVNMRTVHLIRSGKYNEQEGKTTPDHVIHSMWDLVTILREEYQLIL
ncbi:MAG: TIGR02253 family HAD-type hydrolase [Gemmatimonadetes bacterium]|nr:MAG: TIGR02253 family HAD-type hydrolase [Gemmatimonadota bacterium]